MRMPRQREVLKTSELQDVGAMVGVASRRRGVRDLSLTVPGVEANRDWGAAQQ